MLRYLALSWSACDQACAAQADRISRQFCTRRAEWRLLFSAPEIRVLAVADRQGVFGHHRAPHGRGVIVGRLFRKPEKDAAAFAAEELPDAVWSDRGRTLLERYWGRYVAFLYEPDRQSLTVLPDPTGESPCHIGHGHGLTALFSHLEDWETTLTTPLAVNWRYVASSLLVSTPRTIETGLKDVFQLRAGESLHIDAAAHARRTLCWDLPALATQKPIEAFPQAVATARHTVQACVSAWASCYSRIVHALSGIDSAVTLSCLMRSPAAPNVSCLNFYDPTAGSDERLFTRLAANSIRSPTGRCPPLIERRREVGRARLDALSNIESSAVPFGYLACATYLSDYTDCTNGGEAALSTGLGGDYVFYRTSRAEPAVDYVHQHGFGRQLFSIVQANTGNGTYWGTLLRAVRGGLLNRELPPPFPPDEHTFVSADLHERFPPIDSEAPSWFSSQDARALPPNKRRHLQALYRPVRMHDPFRTGTVSKHRSLTWLSPLLSQPILELFARIPVYVLKHRGVERAVIRQAFAEDLPRALVERRSKGVTNHFMHQLFRHHEPFFRELFLDGLLVRERLLERQRVEEFFATAQDGHAEGLSTLIGRYADVEIWLRSRQAQAAAS